MIQRTVQELLKLGPLPASANSDAAKIEKFEMLLSEIQCPISNDDARALVGLFGNDDCFGLAWTLLHAIETAPDWPLEDALYKTANEWIIRLKERAS